MLAPRSLLGGGGGLLSTAADYDRFTQMLLDRPDSPGGELDGTRLLGPRTVRYMTRNHLPGNRDLKTFGRPLYAETPFLGVGFGLGFAVTIDPVPGKIISSAGELTWGGGASTAFWIDPSEELTVSFFTQLLPSSAYPIRSQLRQLVSPGAGGLNGGAGAAHDRRGGRSARKMASRATPLRLRAGAGGYDGGRQIARARAGLPRM